MPNIPPVTRQIAVTVDVVLLTLLAGRLQVLLMRRGREPFRDQLALPGGYIHPQEDDDALAAARRVLLDKTGGRAPYLQQLYTYANGARTPRGCALIIPL